MSIFDFFTREAGQERRRALEGLLTQFIPPEMRPQLGLLAETNPVVSMERAGQDAQQLFAPDQTIMDRIASLGRMSSNIAGTVAPAVVAGRAGVPVANAVQDVLTGYSPMVQPFVADESGALRLFHGSPHDFDRFSMSKIGTGEGAQAYGHGLYFAENEGVARGYRDALTDPDAVPLQFDGRPVNTPWNEEIRERWSDYFKGLSEDDADAMEELLGNLSQVNNMQDVQNVLGGVSSRAKLLYSRIVKPKLVKPDVGAGRMYEVQVDANPEDFINYDAPLSAQPLNIQRQFGYVSRPTPQDEVAAYELAKRESPNDIGNHPAVQGIYSRQSAADAAERNFQRQVTGGGIDDAARIALSEAGIPGIRYLDAGSRGAGDGSRNYVVFDENLIEIVRKYGIAGAAAMLGMSQADVAQAMQQQPQPQGLLAGPQ